MKNASILVVDDFKTVINIVRRQLSSVGYDDIDEAMCGEEALEKIHNRKYDLIISDWNMDRMSGLDLLCEVRKDEDCKDIPFIMITSDNKLSKNISASRAGVSEFVTKPFSASYLESKISKVLEDRAV